MASKTPPARVAYTPAEFAAMFGKSQTWGYRQIYAGTVKTITQHGRILIPSTEVDRILAEAGIYNGEKKRVAKEVTKAELWQRYIAGRKARSTSARGSKRSEALASLRPALGKRTGYGTAPARIKKR